MTLNTREQEHAKKKYGIDLVVEDMHDLHFPDHQFDCVYARESLEHSVAPYLALCEINRVLKPDGYALINIPWPEWIRDDSHYSVMHPDQMRELFYKCRFKVSKEGRSSSGHYWYLAQKGAEVGDPTTWDAPMPARDWIQPVTEKRPRIIAMMRVKNEARWIHDVLKAASRLVDGFVILDDGSTDDTLEICRRFPGVLRCETQHLDTVDEARDKDKLYLWALEHAPDWIIALDGDEILEDAADTIIRREIENCPPEVSIFGFNFLYIWDSEDQQRVDDLYYAQRHERMFKVSELRCNPHEFRFKRTDHGANFHCGSLPDKIPGGTLCIDVNIKHYGCFDSEHRKNKRRFYEQQDPTHAAQGYYDHLTETTDMVLFPWKERHPADALLTDYSPRRLADTLAWHQNRLSEAGYLILPGIQRHLDIGTKDLSTLAGFDRTTLTCVDVDEDFADLIVHAGYHVHHMSAVDLPASIQTPAELYELVTMLNCSQETTLKERDTLMSAAERLATKQIVCFVPIETTKDKEAIWSKRYFEQRGFTTYDLTIFNPDRFGSFLAVKCVSPTDQTMIMRDLDNSKENAQRQQQPPAANDRVERIARLSQFDFDWGRIGATTTVENPTMIINPEQIFLGDKVVIRDHARLETITERFNQRFRPALIIEDEASIEQSVHIGAANLVRIGRKAMIASRVTIMDHDHGYRDPTRPPKEQPLDVGQVIIDDGVWIGENVFVSKNVTIGQNAVIGANSVVTKDIPPFCVAVGSPARVIRHFDAKQQQWLDGPRPQHVQEEREKVVEATYAEAQILADENRYDELVATLNNILREYPDHALTHNNLGAIYHGHGEAWLAQLHLEMATRLDRLNRNAKHNLAEIYRQNQRTKGAKQLYKEILDEYPDDAEALMATSEIYVDEGQMNEALALLGKVRSQSRASSQDAPGN